MKPVWGKFKGLSAALKRQIVQRIGLGVAAVALFVIIWAATGSFRLAVPGMILAVLFFVTSGILLYKCISGKYICIAGTVKQVELTGFRKKPKTVFLDIDGKILLIPVQQKPTAIAVGNKLTLYLSPNTPIYEQNETYRIFTYLALVNDQ